METMMNNNANDTVVVFDVDVIEDDFATEEEITMVNKNNEVSRTTDTDRELIFLEKKIDERFKFIEYSLCYSDGIVITIYKSTPEFRDTYNKYRKDPNRKRYNKYYLLHYLDLLMKNRYVIHEIMVRDELSASVDEDFDIMLECLPKQICGGYNRIIKFLRDFNDEVSKDRYNNKFCNKETFDECGGPNTTHVIECVLGTFRG